MKKKTHLICYNKYIISLDNWIGTIQSNKNRVIYLKKKRERIYPWILPSLYINQKQQRLLRLKHKFGWDLSKI